MATTPTNPVIQHFLAACGRDGMTDEELLTRFLDGRDDAALAALIRRHGPMVWGVCCRLLRSHHDAEDAFQATFLVLVQKAATLPNREKIGNWLYGVAHQTAVRMRAVAAKRGGRERQVTVMPDPTTAEPYAWNDLWPVLDEELSRLPDKYRVLIVLCDLEGVTRKEVARQLNLPEGTAASRLAAARAMLAKRLARRGIVVSSVLLGAVLCQKSAWASGSTTVITSTIKAATLVAAGQAAAGVISPTVVALKTGVTMAMFMTKIKTGMAVALVVGLTLAGIGAGVGLSTNPVAVAQQPGAKPDEAKKSDAKEPPRQGDKAREERKKDKVSNLLTPAQIYRDKVEGPVRIEFVVGAVSIGLPTEMEAKDRPREQPEGGKATLTRLSVTVGEKLEAQLNAIGIKDVRLHLYRKTVRVSGELKRIVVTNDISTLITYTLVLDDINQLESVSEQQSKSPGPGTLAPTPGGSLPGPGVTGPGTLAPTPPGPGKK
jgi:RNA polymerase sigma factor (sigma-70 family)